MEGLLIAKRRATELTDAERQALEQARRILQPFFAGESIRLHVPKLLSAERQARQDRILQALQSGVDPRVISRAEDVSLRHLRRLRVTIVGRIGGRFPP